MGFSNFISAFLLPLTMCLPKHAHYSTIFAKVVSCKLALNQYDTHYSFFFFNCSCMSSSSIWEISCLRDFRLLVNCCSSMGETRIMREREKERESTSELLDAHLRQTTRHSCKVLQSFYHCLNTDFK